MMWLSNVKLWMKDRHALAWRKQNTGNPWQRRSAASFPDEMCWVMNHPIINILSTKGFQRLNPVPMASASPENLLKIQNPCLSSNLSNQKLWRWGPEICFHKIPPSRWFKCTSEPENYWWKVYRAFSASLLQWVSLESLTASFLFPLSIWRHWR